MNNQIIFDVAVRNDKETLFGIGKLGVASMSFKLTDDLQLAEEVTDEALLEYTKDIIESTLKHIRERANE